MTASPRRASHRRQHSPGGKRAAASGLAPRRAAAEIIDLVLAGAPLSAVLEDFSADKSLSPRDAALARAIARATLRRLGDVDYVLGKLLSKKLPRKAAAAQTILRLSAAQLLFMRQADHAAVNTAVAMLKSDAATGGYAGLANAVLRRLTREREALLDALPANANTPAWLWQRWTKAYGAQAAAEMAQMHRAEPPLDLSLPPDAAPPEDGVALPTGGLRLSSRAVDEIEGYAEGRFWVQDFAAQLPTTLLGEVAGKAVLDMCAAPGGKTLQLAAAGAKVTAVEKDPVRAERLRQNLARVGVADRVTVAVSDARQVGGTYDAVLLDAPCTATGTLRRQPDVALHRTAADIPKLAKLQQELLKAAAERTRSGGSVVFATCSLEREEGEDHLSFIAEALPCLSLASVRGGAAAPFATPHGTVRTLTHFAIPNTPGAEGMDGFFAARFVKA
ncbi:MAG: transcription antitermination factor NusB [Pseudomonadota bacterium]